MTEYKTYYARIEFPESDGGIITMAKDLDEAYEKIIRKCENEMSLFVDRGTLRKEDLKILKPEEVVALW